MPIRMVPTHTLNPFAIPTERKASARSSRGPRHVRFFAFARVGVVVGPAFRCAA